MEKDVFLNYTKDLEDGSVKKACYTVREFIKYCEIKTMQNINGKKEFMTIQDKCAVNIDEFLNATRLLLSYSYESVKDDDKNIELYSCECDCAKNHGFNEFCDGEFTLGRDSKAKKLCKYYKDPENI